MFMVVGEYCVIVSVNHQLLLFIIYLSLCVANRGLTKWTLLHKQ